MLVDAFEEDEHAGSQRKCPGLCNWAKQYIRKSYSEKQRGHETAVGDRRVRERVHELRECLLCKDV